MRPRGGTPPFSSLKFPLGNEPRRTATPRAGGAGYIDDPGRVRTGGPPPAPNEQAPRRFLRPAWGFAWHIMPRRGVGHFSGAEMPRHATIIVRAGRAA